MDTKVSLVNISDDPVRSQTFWPTVVLPKAAIDAEIERLASIDRPASGRRVSAVNHPMNTGPVPAYAPGIDVHIQVLKPGERTEPVMRNSTQVEMCIGGVGRVQIGDSDFSVAKFDVWNVPSMAPLVYRNDGQGLFGPIGRGWWRG